MRVLKTYPVILVFAFLSSELYSQSIVLKALDSDLYTTYEKIVDFKFQNPIEWDSVEYMNEIFNQKIQNYTSNFPETLTYDFDSLGRAINILDVADGLFRIYSWDTWSGGTMHFHNSLIQFKSREQVGIKFYSSTYSSENYANGLYTDLFSLKADNNVYYLAICNIKGSSRDSQEAIRIFTLEDHALNDTIGLFKTKEGLLNSIEVPFNFFSVVDRPERPLRLIKYDSDEQIVYIPIVYEDGTVTERYILYKFNGEYFEHIATQRE
jgi:hypothetical protein